MVDFKTIFLEKFEPDIKSGVINSVCDLGSGLSLNFIPLLEKYPNLLYVGIEPSAKHVSEAKKLLSKFNNATVYQSDGYRPVGDNWGKFDLVVSLSVLEHVKQLERFLKNSITAVRAGGQIVHRYDLGHALYPSSIKERLQVFLGNRLPFFLPEDKFVSFLHPDKVTSILSQSGAKVEKTTYHQMPDHKAFLKYLGQNTSEHEDLIREIIEWEFKVGESADQIDESKRFKLFPAIAIYAKKI